MRKEFRRLLVVIAVTLMLFSNVVAVAAVSDVRAATEIPSYQDVYERMIALKEKYPEGMRWDDNYPYSRKNGYFCEAWGGSTAACTAFACSYTDDVFGKETSVRYIGKKKFAYEMIQVGDVLHMRNDDGTNTNHYVVVLERDAEGITVVEGNYNDTVHWGRFITREYIEENFLQLITRYPDTSYHHAAKEKNKKLYDSDGKVVDSYQLKKKTLKYKGIKEKKVAQAGFDMDGDLIFLKTNGTVKVIDHVTLEVRTIYTGIDKLLPKRKTGLIISVKYGKMTERIKK